MTAPPSDRPPPSDDPTPPADAAAPPAPDCPDGKGADAAPPPADPRRRGLGVAIALTILAAVLWRETLVEPPDPPHLALPEPVVRLRMAQHSAEPVPGSDETLFLIVTDVEQDVATVALTAPGRPDPVPRRRMRAGETVGFTVGGTAYILRAAGMRGFLAGADFGAFEIMTRATYRAAAGRDKPSEDGASSGGALPPHDDARSGDADPAGDGGASDRN